MIKFVYVASSLDNWHAVIELQDRLRGEGFAIAHDWAELHKQERAGGGLPDNLARTQVDAIMDADALVLYAPGGRGAHIEYGVAMGALVPTIVLLNNEVRDIGFYRLSPIVHTFAQVIEKLKEML